jgi:hypothetical protein
VAKKEGAIMFYMLVTRWPLSSSDEVGKVTVDVLSKPLPDYLKMLGPYVVPTAEGVKGYRLYEVEDAREWEAYKYLVDQEASYRVIEGYSAVIEPVLSAAEALSMVGLKL